VKNPELGEALSNLLREISKECEMTLKLIDGLKEEGLSVEQMDERLTRLAEAACYLHSHTCGIQDLIFDEIEKLYARKHKAERELRR
jgi:hypothetical protein